MRNLTRLFVAVIFFTGLAHAQLVKYDDDLFGPNAVTLSLSHFRPGADATNLFGKYGVRFSGRDSVPTVVEFVDDSGPSGPVIPGPITHYLVRNEAGGSSSGRAFRIDFANPPRQVGFPLRNPGVVASITAFDADGKPLGTVERVAGTQSPMRIRLAVPAGMGISKLVIDYGTSSQPEEIGDLTLEHQQRPLFETFLPQVADGLLPDGNRLRTAITIVGLSNSTVTGDIRFLNNIGQPLLLRLSSGQSVTWKEVTSFSDNLTITAGNSSPAVAGYAMISTRSPVTAVAAFQVTGVNGVVLSETSVLSTPARYTHSGPVAETAPIGMVGGGGPQPRYQTAVAIANTAWEKNQVRIEVTGQPAVELELQPGEHKPVFIWELFPAIYNTNFQGWLRISSSRPTVAVLLKTKDGLPVSAVPLESLEP